jgi:hypothetical protein
MEKYRKKNIEKSLKSGKMSKRKNAERKNVEKKNIDSVKYGEMPLADNAFYLCNL